MGKSTVPPFRPHSYASGVVSSGRVASDRTLLYGWTGTHWSPKDEDEAEREAYHWLVKERFEWANADNARKACRAACLFAPPLPALTAQVVVPTRNGYVHLEGAELVLRPADPALGLTHALECEFVPDGPAPRRFVAFLEQVLPDTEVRSRVQEYVGYTLLADARYQRAQFWLGQGANGKGVLANIVQALHGRTAAMSLDQMGGFQLSALVGASLIYVDEAPRKPIDEQRLKIMIAWERIGVDRKYRDPVSVHIRGKWLVLGNHLPVITDHSIGFWRRWDIVPFSITIPERGRDPLLARTIIECELSGVLGWALEGLIRLQRRGRFDPVLPKVMACMLHEAQADTNSVVAWLDDCEPATITVCSTPKELAFAHYRAWCSASAMHEVSMGQFWKRLKDQVRELHETRIRIDGRQRRMCNLDLGSSMSMPGPWSVESESGSRRRQRQ